MNIFAFEVYWSISVFHQRYWVSFFEKGRFP